jgi:hypothetical protein
VYCQSARAAGAIKSIARTSRSVRMIVVDGNVIGILDSLELLVGERNGRASAIPYTAPPAPCRYLERARGKDK